MRRLPRREGPPRAGGVRCAGIFVGARRKRSSESQAGLASEERHAQRVTFILEQSRCPAYYSERRQDTGTPLPIAVSSFGEGLRRGTPSPGAAGDLLV